MLGGQSQFIPGIEVMESERQRALGELLLTAAYQSDSLPTTHGVVSGCLGDAWREQWLLGQSGYSHLNLMCSVAQTCFQAAVTHSFSGSTSACESARRQAL